ncbi:MAG TPA: hypothetical protein VHZ75_02800 [Solirubrobacteraceae bacterium]|nr:hypothetical protein [Solirubrobacteraceae bacterium]
MAVSRQRIGFAPRIAQPPAAWNPARRQHEQSLAAFVVAKRRERFARSLDDPGRRAKLHEELHRFEHRLDPRFAHLHAGRAATHRARVDEVVALLRSAGAPPMCFVLAYGELDGRELILREAIDSLLWTGSGFISCVAGHLGLYAGEDGSNVFLLVRDD